MVIVVIVVMVVMMVMTVSVCMLMSEFMLVRSQAFVKQPASDQNDRDAR